MFIALFLLSGATHLVPVRWNSSDPKSLDLLTGTPVNCILLEPENWRSQLIDRAASRHIVTLGVLHPETSSIEQSRHAAGLKMSGVVLEGDYESAAAEQVRAAIAGTSLEVIQLPTRGRMRLDGNTPITGTWQALWPGVEIEHGGKISTGPTSAPWINTNTGFLRFVRAASDAAIWLGERPPSGTVFPVGRYLLAVADAAIAGARWIVAMDSDLEHRLWGGDAAARQAWRRINTYIRYFDDKPEWRDYRPFSQFTLIEDANSGGLLSSGLLDMLSVQHTAVRALPTSRLNAKALDGARVVLNVDAESLDAQKREDLKDFAASGGVVVNPPRAWRFPVILPSQIVPTRKQVDQMQPVWEATYNATARKNFGIRTFNTSSVLFNLLETRDGKSLLIHLLNYADLPAEDVTVYVLGTWHRARLYQPEAEVTELPLYQVREGTGIDIAKIAVLATLRLD